MSLRKRLFVILLAATGLIWLSAAAWIFVSTRIEVEQVLDTRLREAANMVDSLVSNANLQPDQAVSALKGSSFKKLNYERQLSCQIWSLDGSLLAQSNGAPESKLSDQPAGFSNRTIDGVSWRVYAIENSSSGLRVLVGDRLELRDRLVADLIKGLLAPLVLVVPALALLLWFSLGSGLRPLRAMAGDLAEREPGDLSDLETGRLPRELKPLGRAINSLFARVSTARRRERDVTAFAAHELRTPLAGLKTQAQIALTAGDETVRKSALEKIIVSVDRSSRLVRQLLNLARLDAGEDTPAPPKDWVDLGELAREITEAAPSPARAVRIECDPQLDTYRVHVCSEHLLLALRNLHENAREHSPPNATIRWRLEPQKGRLIIEDEGLGMSDEVLRNADQRFFRGRSSAGGSGLGLSIATSALAQIGGRLILQNRTDRSGLAAIVELPALAQSTERRAAQPA